VSVVLANDTTASSVPTEVVIAVGIVALIAVPGYALGVVSARGSRDPDGGEQAFLARTALASVVVHGLVLWWTIPLAEQIRTTGLQRQAAQISAWLFVVCVGLPVLLGNIEAWFGRRNPETLAGRIAATLGIAGSHRAANAWSDMAEGRTDAAGFALITLRDGRIMTGFCGDRSYMSADSRKHDLYLQHAVEVGPNRRFVKVPDSRGFWVNGDDIVSIEFFLSDHDYESVFERRRPRLRSLVGTGKDRRAEGKAMETDPDEHVDALTVSGPAGTPPGAGEIPEPSSGPGPESSRKPNGKVRSAYRSHRQRGRSATEPDTLTPPDRGIQRARGTTAAEPEVAAAAVRHVDDPDLLSAPEEKTK